MTIKATRNPETRLTPEALKAELKNAIPRRGRNQRELSDSEAVRVVDHLSTLMGRGWTQSAALKMAGVADKVFNEHMAGERSIPRTAYERLGWLVENHPRIPIYGRYSAEQQELDPDACAVTLAMYEAQQLAEEIAVTAAAAWVEESLPEPSPEEHLADVQRKNAEVMEEIEARDREKQEHQRTRSCAEEDELEERVQAHGRGNGVVDISGRTASVLELLTQAGRCLEKAIEATQVIVRAEAEAAAAYAKVEECLACARDRARPILQPGIDQIIGSLKHARKELDL